jgi:hypothetical protein
MNAIPAIQLKTVCLRARSFISFEDAFEKAKISLDSRFSNIQSCVVTDELCESDENDNKSYFVDIKLIYHL